VLVTKINFALSDIVQFL